MKIMKMVKRLAGGGGGGGSPEACGDCCRWGGYGSKLDAEMRENKSVRRFGFGGRSPTSENGKRRVRNKIICNVVYVRYLLRPHFYSYPLMPSMTGSGVLQVRAPKRFA